MTDTPERRTLHASMLAASTAIGAVAKNLRNVESMYAARSIDDILDAVHGPLADAGVVLTVEVIDRQTEIRGRMNYVAYLVRFTFHGEDGTQMATTVWGEGADVADKAGNKALSAALKMALIQTFTIPVNGEAADADTTTPAGATPLADPDRVGLLLAQLKTAHDRTGKAYPPRWRASGLSSIPWIRDHGMTNAEVEVAEQILADYAAALDAASPETAPPPASPDDEPMVADLPYTCPVCGLNGAHEPNCPEEVI